MTGRDLASIEAAVSLLQRGRANAAHETLVTVIRENGGTVPTPPGTEPPPPPPTEPAAMRGAA